MIKLSEAVKEKRPVTCLIYCAPGVGKSTFLGIIGEQSKGNTLVLDIDRTFIPTMSKNEVVHDFDRIEVWEVDNVNTWDDWEAKLKELKQMKEDGKLDYENICVDNLSELERCILSDLGSKGKNKGVPAQADYQYMQFKLVNTLRFLKSLGCNIYLTAWEINEQFQNPDGSYYTRLYPRVSAKIVDNICGLCDVVGKIRVDKEGRRGIQLEASQNVYAKNQRDTRKGCLVEDFMDKGDEENG